MLKKTINVKFNSNFKLNGSTNDDAKYYIDWSAILKNDNQHYSVVWSYTSQQSVFDPDTKIASIHYTQIQRQIHRFIHMEDLIIIMLTLSGRGLYPIYDPLAGFRQVGVLNKKLILETRGLEDLFEIRNTGKLP